MTTLCPSPQPRHMRIRFCCWILATTVEHGKQLSRKHDHGNHSNCHVSHSGLGIGLPASWICQEVQILSAPGHCWRWDVLCAARAQPVRCLCAARGLDVSASQCVCVVVRTPHEACLYPLRYLSYNAIKSAPQSTRALVWGPRTNASQQPNCSAGVAHASHQPHMAVNLGVKPFESAC